ncbi:hypothetical protein SISNIDRAFT_399263, partial [Sistotremastrum niveocremeum HHB9708]
IQRPLKQEIQRRAHAHVVQDVLQKLKNGTPPKRVKPNRTIGVLRNRSVEWIVRGYEAINNSKLVKKAFELCRAGEFNLSYESLTSDAMRKSLRDLKRLNP